VRFLSLVKSTLFCNVINWYVEETIKHQAYIINRFNYLSTAGLILAFIVFYILITRNKQVELSELHSPKNYSPLATHYWYYSICILYWVSIIAFVVHVQYAIFCLFAGWLQSTLSLCWRYRVFAFSYKWYPHGNLSSMLMDMSHTLEHALVGHTTFDRSRRWTSYRHSNNPQLT
jgi:hypothetical protein